MNPIRRLVPVALCAGALLAAGLPAAARADAMTPAKSRDVQTLMTMLNMDQMRQGMAGQLANALANNTASKMKKATRAQQEKTGRLVAEEAMGVLKANDSLLASRQAEILGNAFTADEVRQLVAFYQSPVGKKTQTVLPGIIENSMQAGQAWGQALAPQIERAVVARAARDRVLLPNADGRLGIPPPDAANAAPPPAAPRR